MAAAGQSYTIGSLNVHFFECEANHDICSFFATDIAKSGHRLDVLCVQECILNHLCTRPNGRTYSIEICPFYAGKKGENAERIELYYTMTEDEVERHLCASFGVSPQAITIYEQPKESSTRVPLTHHALRRHMTKPCYIRLNPDHGPATVGQEYTLGRLAHTLDMPYVAFGTSMPGNLGFFGNAVLSRVPFTEAMCRQLESTPELQVSCPPPWEYPQTRGLTTVCLPGLRLAVVHLDHVYEQLRTHQLITVAETLSGSAPTLLIGDFNSLRQCDYSESQWASIVSIREKNRWEEPRPEVMETALSLGFRDSFYEVNPNALPAPTCRFNTRVDYGMLKGAISALEYGTYHSHSDHQLLVVKVKVG
ncbi:Endonuclease/Exonuclease/phosphatase domain containing protein [Carpediemonas membranifera]|uniref:Endonuclease/Exonuclease/phosphatase domain containing protein n=1 Tax=Carpediemonas membranifera TaxID=201153 RepID=A0A8J6BAV3_9EUKA|nr:Endonuclease/Exonuclease/phosphatase domain containing protein [Carpediemonas membranifera]|eukprot:KAG9396884.1 Endonuclease/Exonuclease/phosphatase domain containing protein [Carpediemonas membranifera]